VTVVYVFDPAYPAELARAAQVVKRHSAIRARRIDMAKPPLIFTFYIAAPIERVWNGFVSKETNGTIFMGADFEVDLRPGGAMTWSGPDKDGQRTRYVTGEVISVDAPTRLEYKFGMGDGTTMSRVTIALTQETEAVKVVVTNDQWADDDPAYLQNADGWPRILSRLKTLLETGKTFRPH
jgi:uncharacterized protein YndB with AHSA1/START domain